MTFTSAIQNLRSGEAAKRESWTGYVLKQDAPDTTNETPKYDFVFVQRDGTRYVYAFGTDSKDTPCQLTKVLLEGFMADDWIRGSAEEFEKARTGTGGEF